jgi:hypothetical protein
MAIKFIDKGHIYESIENDGIKWISVTSILSKFKKPFDPDSIAEKCATNKKSKWYGLTATQIKDYWKQEVDDAIILGTWYHNQRESDILEFNTITRNNIDLPIFKSHTIDGIKYAPEQKLINGIYPEHMVYLKSAGICGQADRVEVIDGYVNISDYKTNKEIKTEGFVNWEGKRDTLLAPLDHLDNCELLIYGLQLSIYMYIILKHNPKLKPGKLTIEHIIFEEHTRNKYNVRNLVKDHDGKPLFKDMIQYEVPYYKDEVITIINHLKDVNTKS